MSETVTIRHTCTAGYTYLLRIDYSPGFYNPPDDIDEPEVEITEAVHEADDGPERLDEREREILADDEYERLVEACEAVLRPKRDLDEALQAVADDEAAYYADMADGMAEDLDVREREGFGD